MTRAASPAMPARMPDRCARGAGAVYNEVVMSSGVHPTIAIGAEDAILLRAARR